MLVDRRVPPKYQAISMYSLSWFLLELFWILYIFESTQNKECNTLHFTNSSMQWLLYFSIFKLFLVYFGMVTWPAIQICWTNDNPYVQFPILPLLAVDLMLAIHASNFVYSFAWKKSWCAHQCADMLIVRLIEHFLVIPSTCRFYTVDGPDNQTWYKQFVTLVTIQSLLFSSFVYLMPYVLLCVIFLFLLKKIIIFL